MSCSSSREPNNKAATTVATTAPVETVATENTKAVEPIPVVPLDDTLHLRQVNWRDVRITVRVRGNADSELSIKITKPNEELPEFVTGWSGSLLGQVLVADLNQNNEPEIFIAAVDPEKNWNMRSSARSNAPQTTIRFDLPELTEKQNGGYRGGDLFWFDNLTICRAIESAAPGS